MTQNKIPIEWIDEADEISIELSKTLMIISALLIFFTAIPTQLVTDINTPLWMYGIPWILLMLSLFCGVLFHLLRNHRLRKHIADRAHKGQKQQGIFFESYPYRGETVCIVLQPLFLLLGLTATGFLVLW